MKLSIRSEKGKITKSMKEYAEDKITKLEKYLEKPDEVKCNILFKVRGPKQKTEITIPLSNCTLRVEEEGQDFYAAIDTSIDKLERQIVKNKTRLLNKRNKSKHDLALEFETITEENKDKIEKRKAIELKPMDEEEAILQMELLNHDFYMFKDIETDRVSVLYKRKNKGYGIIEQE